MREDKFNLDSIGKCRTVSVCCGGTPPRHELKLAYEVGKHIAMNGAILVCGGLGGSMEEACRGAREEGGLTVGILPVYEKDAANRFVDIIVPTGLGHARNNIVVAMGDGVIGVGGSWGTLSEIAISMKMGKPVAVLNGWRASGPDGITGEFRKVATPEEAVKVALGLM